MRLLTAGAVTAPKRKIKATTYRACAVGVDPFVQDSDSFNGSAHLLKLVFQNLFHYDVFVALFIE